MEDGETRSLWLGLELPDKDDNFLCLNTFCARLGWSWADGTKLTFSTDYSNWAYGYPQSGVLGVGCAHMMVDTGQWISARCTSEGWKTGVVCEKGQYGCRGQNYILGLYFDTLDHENAVWYQYIQ